MDEDNQGRVILFTAVHVSAHPRRCSDNYITVTIILLRPITRGDGELAAGFCGVAASRRSRTAGVYPGACTLAQQVVSPVPDLTFIDSGHTPSLLYINCKEKRPKRRSGGF